MGEPIRINCADVAQMLHFVLPDIRLTLKLERRRIAVSAVGITHHSKLISHLVKVFE